MRVPAVHLVVLGPMGVGKSTVGTIAADRLGWSLVDSDRVIEALHGRTGSDIARNEGVDRLHRIEAEVFDEALGFAPPSVIAPAASVADDAALLDRMRSPQVVGVLLDCDPAVLADRAAGARHRRQIGPADAADLVARRRRALLPVVDGIVDVTDLPPGEVATRLLDYLPAEPE